MPPFLSSSANCNDDLSSYKVSPPNKEAIKTPSSFRLRITLLKQPGKSFIQCRLNDEITKSKECSENCALYQYNRSHIFPNT